MNGVTWADTLDTIRYCVAADIENDYLTHDTDVDEYAEEFADGVEWVVYYSQALALWADSKDVRSYEDEAWDLGPVHDINTIITRVVYLATRAAVADEVQSQLDAKGLAS